MMSEGKPSEARLGFRVLAGIIAALVFTTACPMAAIVAVRSDPSMWLVEFPSLLVVVWFATAAFTGHWLCFNSARDEYKR